MTQFPAPQFPAPGTRVAIRSRRPAGAVPPFTDTVGELVSTGEIVKVHGKSGAVVEISIHDIVAVRPLPTIPVMNRDIRSMQRAAAFSWPGLEHAWIAGWFLRAGQGYSLRANSAVPLEHSSLMTGIDDVVQWYESRGLPAILCLPDRLIFPPRELPTHSEAVVMVRGIYDAEPIELPDRPSVDWIALQADTEMPARAVLTAVIDGTLGFASILEGGRTVAVARGAVTEGWLGISAVKVAASHRRRGLARQLCQQLLGWGASQGARRAYVQIPTHNNAGLALCPTLGFSEQHRYRYATVATQETPVGPTDSTPVTEK